MTPTPPSRGEQLDRIMRDLDATGATWAAAGYGYDTPEYAAREAVFVRLREWNGGATTPGGHPQPGVPSAPSPTEGTA